MANNEPKDMQTELEQGTEDTSVQPTDDTTSGENVAPLQLAMRVRVEATAPDEPPEPIKG